MTGCHRLNRYCLEKLIWFQPLEANIFPPIHVPPFLPPSGHQIWPSPPPLCCCRWSTKVPASSSAFDANHNVNWSKNCHNNKSMCHYIILVESICVITDVKYYVLGNTSVAPIFLFFFLLYFLHLAPVRQYRQRYVTGAFATLNCPRPRTSKAKNIYHFDDKI